MTFLADHSASDRHDLAGHPETVARAQAIRTAWERDPRASKMARVVPDRLLTRDEAIRVHSQRLWDALAAADGQGTAMLDADTYAVPGSLEAARGTARLCIQAAERSLLDDEPGFVLARPPGHHATRERSMGFCLVNNVALAAVAVLRMGARRVLVFDHDVHHGNGTQEIFYDSERVMYQSFHLHPHFPMTGRAEEIGEDDGAGFTVNAPLGPGDGDAEVRSLLVNVFLPLAKRFAPDVVLVSAGYDGLVGDPLGGLRLSTGFMGEIASRLRGLTPRVVAVLEGGYQPERVADGVLATIAGLDREVPVGMTTKEPAVEAELRRLFDLN